ncbi:MAG: cysteine desulfurase [Lentisphaerae bacterium]|nr:cysteine desulfurase [Lentisphaerota bacterium]
MSRIYLDYNASTPIAPEVAEAMRPFLADHYGNPSSHHWAGIPAREAVERARSQVAGLLGCEPDEVVFTSGGTESNNYAIKGAFFALREQGNHIITTEIEHPAVLNPCRFLERLGAEVTCLPVDDTGMVDPDRVRDAITERTILVTVMHANNEVGTIQPVEEISQITREQGVLLHTDAAQSVGKIPVKVRDMGADMLSVAGHKVYAPKGIGALFMRRGVSLEPFMHGAGHESGRRAGTENVLLDVALGKACEVAGRDMDGCAQHLMSMRNELDTRLQEKVGETRLNGHPQKRLPNTLSVGIQGVEANELLDEISDQVAASAGSACHSGGVEISGVLKAMEVPVEWARGTLRLSTGRMTTREDISGAVGIITEAVERLRNG